MVNLLILIAYGFPHMVEANNNEIIDLSSLSLIAFLFFDYEFNITEKIQQDMIP